jgi:phosphohistidine phosphatase
MQHTLLIMRHGKARTDNYATQDCDRRLSIKGELEVAEMASEIRTFFEPQIILCSSALRTKNTAEIVCKQNGWNPKIIVLLDELYLANPSEILSILADLNNTTTCAMLVGHNPGLTELIQKLPHVNIDNLPTAGYAFVRLAVNDWSELSKSLKNSTLESINYPKK